MALSGAGLLCIEATAVEAEGRITVGDLGLWNDVTEAALQPVLAAIHNTRRSASSYSWLMPGAKPPARPYLSPVSDRDPRFLELNERAFEGLRKAGMPEE
jgi:2,4-dienoyl-CoA reductase-like NADH-dependent reductase (Old Yellow Enzyme family)